MSRADEVKAAGRGLLARFKVPIGGRATLELLTWAAIAIGVVLRLLDYGENRPLYRDERSLLENLVRLEVFDFHTTLTEYQLAPPGFLVLERMLVRLPGNDIKAARFFPLACGLASLLLFRATARRFVLPRAVPIAMGLFALSDWLIYYSAEIKQYSCDLGLALAALLLTPGPSTTRPTGRRLAALGIFGAVGVWFSYPLALVLAGVGTYLMATAAIRRDVRTAAALAATGLAWAASFGVCYVVSHGILSKERFLWDWWDFAFLRVPPRSLAELQRELWQIVNVFDSPADVKTPLGMIPTALLAAGLWLAGAVSLGRRWRGGLYLLAAPIVFTLAASALRQYPFHGRLLIFLVPAVQLLVAEGAAAISRPGGPLLTAVLGGFLMLQPASDRVWQQFVQPLNHDNYDSHGDLRPDLLDYLDSRRTRP